MEFSLLSPGQQYDLLSQSAEAERAIAAYQTREGIPSTINTPSSMRPPPPGTRGLNLPLAPLPPDPNVEPPRPELLRSGRSQTFQEIVRNTRRRNYADFKRALSEATPSQLRLMERYVQESRSPDFLADRLRQEIRARGLEPQSFSERPRSNPTPPNRPPSTAAARPTPTSLNNSPALRTAQTSGLRAPITATAPPRPALPSHWNLYQPPGSPPPPPTRRNIPAPPDSPPPGLPQAGARGRLAYGAAGGLADFGLRLAAGQDIGQAAYGAAAGVAGSLAGQGLGQAVGAGLGFALGGPPGAAVGGILGGFVGGIAGGYTAGRLADRYYPGVNAPLPGTPIPGRVESSPIPRPLAPPQNPLIPGPPIPFQPRPLNSPPLLGRDGQIGQGIGPYRIFYDYPTGSGDYLTTFSGLLWGPVAVTLLYGLIDSYWTVRVLFYGEADRLRSQEPQISNTNHFVSQNPERRAPRNFRIVDFSRPGSQPQPAFVPNPFAANPQNAPRPNPNNSPRDQYFPNPLPQTPPSPTGRPSGSPNPGNLGGNEPALQPQRSPDRAAQPTPGDRAYPPASPAPASPAPTSPIPSGASPGRGNFPTVPFLPVAAPSPLPRQQRASVTVTAQRPVPSNQPRGFGPFTPPPAPPTPEEPCRGNRCAQRQLQGIDNANNRLANLERILLGGGEAASTAAILQKLEQIDQKLGPQIPGGGIGNFLKRFWDNLGISRILNVLTFITTLHNAKLLSQDIAETLLFAFDQALSLARFDDFLKTSEGQRISLSEWIGNQVNNFAKAVLGDDTVEEIKLKWQRLNRIYQAAQNLLFAFQSILFSVQEALEVIGQWVARIGNALKKYGVVFERAYAWMNPNPDFSSRFFTRLERAEEIASALATVTGSIKEVEESIEYFSSARQELKNQLETGIDDPEQTAPENQPKKDSESQAKIDSAPPEIEESELNPPEGDDAVT